MSFVCFVRRRKWHPEMWQHSFVWGVQAWNWAGRISFPRPVQQIFQLTDFDWAPSTTFKRQSVEASKDEFASWLFEKGAPFFSTDLRVSAIVSAFLYHFPLCQGWWSIARIRTGGVGVPSDFSLVESFPKFTILDTFGAVAFGWFGLMLWCCRLLCSSQVPWTCHQWLPWWLTQTSERWKVSSRISLAKWVMLRDGDGDDKSATKSSLKHMKTIKSLNSLIRIVHQPRHLCTEKLEESRHQRDSCFNCRKVTSFAPTLVGSSSRRRDL